MSHEAVVEKIASMGQVVAILHAVSFFELKIPRCILLLSYVIRLSVVKLCPCFLDDKIAYFRS